MTFMGVLAAVAALFAAAGAAHAQTDHLNLEEGLPARVEDAYPTAFRNREFQAVPRYERTSDGSNQVLLLPTLELGLVRNAQLKLAVPVFVGGGDKTGSGDIRLDGLYNFNVEGLTLPAVALAARADIPSGRQRRGVDTELKLLATKSISNRLDRLHFNAIYLRAGSPDLSERRDRYALVLGYSGRLGPDMMLVADVVREQERERGAESNLIELGLRRQLSPLTVLSAGGGVGLGDESPEFRITVGLQHSLTFLWF